VNALNAAVVAKSAATIPIARPNQATPSAAFAAGESPAARWTPRNSASAAASEATEARKRSGVRSTGGQGQRVNAIQNQKTESPGAPSQSTIKPISVKASRVMRPAFENGPPSARRRSGHRNASAASAATSAVAVATPPAGARMSSSRARRSASASPNVHASRRRSGSGSIGAPERSHASTTMSVIASLGSRAAIAPLYN